MKVRVGDIVHGEFGKAKIVAMSTHWCIVETEKGIEQVLSWGEICLPSEPEVLRTVQVRIAVAVDPEGNWHASGWSGENGTPVGREAMEIAASEVRSGGGHYWVEARLPIPETPSVQGRLVAASPPTG
jgi:hypothetical protein